eukprot:TRINITY_DN6565_c0_g1_i20.p1 TRINITY_DN6565_c0_g1~~TRINITY_DN6565_c0_g1_i20.p1  ORF type:complete len:104 (-),score=6.53 TRINITY_DN6565_c0_g1_i20:144-455(-)
MKGKHQSEISCKCKPLLLRLSVVKTFPETARQLKTSTLGGAKPSQTRETGDMAPDTISKSLKRDFKETTPEGQGFQMHLSVLRLQRKTLERRLNKDPNSNSSY